MTRDSTWARISGTSVGEGRLQWLLASCAVVAVLGCAPARPVNAPLVSLTSDANPDTDTLGAPDEPPDTDVEASVEGAPDVILDVLPDVVPDVPVQPPAHPTLESGPVDVMTWQPKAQGPFPAENPLLPSAGPPSLCVPPGVTPTTTSTTTELPDKCGCLPGQTCPDCGDNGWDTCTWHSCGADGYCIVTQLGALSPCSAGLHGCPGVCAATGGPCINPNSIQCPSETYCGNFGIWGAAPGTSGGACNAGPCAVAGTLSDGSGPAKGQTLYADVKLPINDDNVCTLDTCGPCTGPVHANISGACQIGDTCGQCAAGVCSATPSPPIFDVGFAAVQFTDVTLTTDGAISLQGMGKGVGWDPAGDDFIAQASEKGVPQWQLRRETGFVTLPTPLGNGDLLIWPFGYNTNPNTVGPSYFFRVDHVSGLVTPTGIVATAGDRTIVVLPDDSLAFTSYGKLQRRGLDGTALPGWTSLAPYDASGYSGVSFLISATAGASVLATMAPIGDLTPFWGQLPVIVLDLDGNLLQKHVDQSAPGDVILLGAAGAPDGTTVVWGNLTPTFLNWPYWGGSYPASGTMGYVPWAAWLDPKTGAVLHTANLDTLSNTSVGISGFMLPDGGVAIKSHSLVAWTDSTGKTIGTAKIPSQYGGMRLFGRWPDGSMGLWSAHRLVRLPFKWTGCP
jgi:hypothetical protein